jgi:hypothetical protein
MQGIKGMSIPLKTDRARPILYAGCRIKVSSAGKGWGRGTAGRGLIRTFMDVTIVDLRSTFNIRSRFQVAGCLPVASGMCSS